MFDHAVESAAQPNSPLKAPTPPVASCEMRGELCSKPSIWDSNTARLAAATWANLCCREAKADSSALGVHPPRIPPSARGHASGPFRRPAARRRSASASPPFQGPGSSQKKFESRGNERRSNFFRAPPRKHSLALGSGAHSLGFA